MVDVSTSFPQKSKTSNNTDTSVDKMSKYFENRKSKVVLDHTDHHSDSFKMLPHIQINLKLKMAQMFEMNDLVSRSNSVGTLCNALPYSVCDEQSSTSSASEY